MTTVERLFADYSDHHRTPGNKACHKLGIPMILLGLLGGLERVTIAATGWGRLDAAIILIALVTLYYLRLEWRLALAMLVVSVAAYAGGRTLSLPLLGAIFVLGWILQFIGHGVYEKRQPAFLRNLTHLLVGPLWIVNDVLHVVAPAGSGEPEGEVAWTAPPANAVEGRASPPS